MSLFPASLPPLKCLTTEELDNPEQVFINFFENFNLADAKKLIEEAKEIVVRKKFRFRPYSIEEDNTKFFFEKLEKLVAAAWMIKN